ncbi:MAG: FG-GAP-like repeat-containing protein [Myxococcota bacterium]
MEPDVRRPRLHDQGPTARHPARRRRCHRDERRARRLPRHVDGRPPGPGRRRARRRGRRRALRQRHAPSAGRAVVFPGNVHSASTPPTPSPSAQGDHPFSQLGANLASPGDIDGDGEPDLVVSAPDNWNFSYEPGRIYIFRGPLAGPLTTADAAWVLHGDRPGEGAGFGLTAGDIDHDGRADLVVGAPTNDDAGYAAGKVYVLLAADLP